MKSILASIVLLLCGVARADTFDTVLDRVQATNLAQRDELIATRSELEQVKLKAATAIQANIEQNATFKGQIKAKDVTIAKQSKVLGRWYVRLAILIANAIVWIGSIAGILYVLAFVGGVCRPGTALFELSGKLISFLPWANIVESGISLFHKTVTVRAAVTPIVAPPAAVTNRPADSQLAANLAAMAESIGRTAAPSPGVDFNNNLGWPYAKPATASVI